ncbi:MAG: MarR family transcriptional regulator [Erysipelotrichaceae bacterium]|nr:MarR family transcriptional regulator [Erysipelotrichaceae bacterium]
MTNDKLTKEMVLAARFMKGYQNRPRGQETILKVLAEEEKLQQQDIQQYLQVSPGTVSEMISKLEHKGLVERKRSAEDRRAVEISLTENGKEYLNTLTQEDQDDVFAVLSEEEKETLYEILVKLNNDLLRKIPLERGKRMHPEFRGHGFEGRNPFEGKGPHFEKRERGFRPEEGEFPFRGRGRNFEGRFRFVGEEREKKEERIHPDIDKKHTI